mmetsp:Transcript_3495/g.3929  ORF Transcript_3495/g.3929 Transcript_3495/m.3929 type:complete len:322 (+) Transcript_3495:158-1123(+)
MGGDDLESEDEYLDQSWATKTDKRLSTVLDESTTLDRPNTSVLTSKKRGALSTTTSNNDADDSDGENDETSEALSKRQKTGTPRNLLLDAGRGIAEEGTDVQAVFLWTCFTHFRKMDDKGQDDEHNGDDDTDTAQPTTGVINEADKFTQSQFATCRKDDTHQPQRRIYDRSIVTFLKNGALPSLKRLKKWKHTQSPMVLIMCISARRAVALLKDLSSLNCRVAKLFAKHMDVEDQVAMLEQNSYGIAVCTPNRCLKLFGDGDAKGALSLESTELVLVDCHEDHKRFTVCTMNDTAPDLMKFIDIAVLPQMRKRKTIKFAMF